MCKFKLYNGTMCKFEFGDSTVSKIKLENGAIRKLTLDSGTMCKLNFFDSTECKFKFYNGKMCKFKSNWFMECGRNIAVLDFFHVLRLYFKIASSNTRLLVTKTLNKERPGHPRLSLIIGLIILDVEFKLQSTNLLKRIL